MFTLELVSPFEKVNFKYSGSLFKPEIFSILSMRGIQFTFVRVVDYARITKQD